VATINDLQPLPNARLHNKPVSVEKKTINLDLNLKQG